MRNVNHYKLINELCDADYRNQDVEKDHLKSIHIGYLEALHLSMEKLSYKKECSCSFLWIRNLKNK